MELLVKLKYIFQELRWYQWYKGLLIFACLLWMRQVTATDINLLIAGFVAINLTSSIVYICNDLKDIPLDKKHPTKKLRPMAMGSLTPLEGYALLLMLCGLLFILLGLMGSPLFAGLLLIYVLLNFFYTFAGKHIPYIDLIILGILLSARVVAGFIIVGLMPSVALLITVFTLSLFMTSAQRLAELEVSGVLSRPALRHYDVTTLRFIMTLAMMLTVVFYFIALAFVGIPLVYTDALYFLILLYVNEIMMSAESAEEWARHGLIAFFRSKKLVTVGVVFLLTVLVIFMWFR